MDSIYIYIYTKEKRIVSYLVVKLKNTVEEEMGRRHLGFSCTGRCSLEKLSQQLSLRPLCARYHMDNVYKHEFKVPLNDKDKASLGI